MKAWLRMHRYYYHIVPIPRNERITVVSEGWEDALLASYANLLFCVFGCVGGSRFFVNVIWYRYRTGTRVCGLWAVVCRRRRKVRYSMQVDGGGEE